MSLAAWLSLAAICLLGAMSPGPSLATVVSNTLSRGRAAGLLAAVSHGAGVGLYGLLTVTGLAIVITGSPALFLSLQLAGGTYLVWLGVRSLRSAAADIAPETGHDGSPAREGFLVAFLNPKLAVFMLALFSQFLQPDSDWTYKAVMVATVGGIDATWYMLVALLLSHSRVLDRLRRRRTLIDRAFGIILIVLAITVIYRSLA